MVIFHGHINVYQRVNAYDLPMNFAYENHRIRQCPREAQPDGSAAGRGDRLDGEGLAHLATGKGGWQMAGELYSTN